MDFLEISPRGKNGAIKLTHLDAVLEPQNLTVLKQTIVRRWGMVVLIDALKEAGVALAVAGHDRRTVR